MCVCEVVAGTSAGAGVSSVSVDLGTEALFSKSAALRWDLAAAFDLSGMHVSGIARDRLRVLILRVLLK